MTGAERVWRELKQLGMDTVFGVPGGAVLPLVDALSTYQDVPFVVTRHESAAIHAADGYARASGKPGVALVTSGPGGTNSLTGLMTAMTDSTPLVVLVGQVPTTLIGTDAFQEADLFTMAMSVVKHSWKVERADDVGTVIREAYALATTGRPGPVLVEFPKDVQLALEQNGAPVSDAARVTASTRFELSPTMRARLRAYFGRARRPLLYVGGGVVSSGTEHWIRLWSERYDAPVTTTLLGLGAFPADHPHALGMLGMHGTYAANHAIQEADLILALGVRFDDRVTGRVDRFAPKARIIHVEIDQAEHNKLVRPDVTIPGDLRSVLPVLDSFIPQAYHNEWMSTIRMWQKEHPLRIPSAPVGHLSSPEVLVELSAALHDEDVVVTDVGQHQMWAALFVKRNRPRRFLTSGGAGTMGYGLPAAIGAQMAVRDDKVVLIAGDGSFQMNLQELATVSQYRIPIVIMVMNNGGHGMVRQWQDLFHGKRRHGVALTNPDFVELARVFGIRGMTVESPDQLREALAHLHEIEGPLLLEVKVDPNEMVFPMVPAGQSLSEMIEE
ncbi:MAG: acetolactate synthase, large subunit, biosynthetic type [Sulfobacillus acidophilus]|uniref:Acetolactate synthase n=1 Tax=Sulfobacillus acidophilus TaxID=53633 RepID=A0A2T2WKP3_9FIRM|nr:MAG: acetolactate synthase, large subunit, biosynthetic type [Sulfobacillus acidophilus]